MKTIVTILICGLSLNTFAQKIQKEFWGLSKQVSFEYQTDNAGVKNGYFKSFTKIGLLVQSGSYKAGKQSGVWTEFDERGSGQPIATYTYADNKLNGPSKLWKISGGKRWLWHDDVFKNGDKVSGVTYYSNGKKEEELKNGYLLTYTEDGTPNEQIINGKLFTYYVKGDGERVLHKVQFDTLGNKAMYFYGSNSLSSFSLDDKNVKYKNIEYYDYSNAGDTKPKIHLDGNPNSEPIELDSANVRKAMMLYMSDPNPKKSTQIIYDDKTGDIIDSKYWSEVWRGYKPARVHYLGTPKNTVFVTGYNANGKKEMDFYFKYNVHGTPVQFGTIREYDENGNLKK